MGIKAYLRSNRKIGLPYKKHLRHMPTATKKKTSQKIEFIQDPNTIQDDIANLIRMHGTKSKDNSFRLNIGALKLIVDGRNHAEEYDDEDNECPCKVDYVAVDSDSIKPWFHMYTAYASWSPLASNDKYSLGAMSFTNINKIYDFIVMNYGTSTKDKKRLEEIRRAKWMKTAQDHDNMILRGSFLKTNEKTGKDLPTVREEGKSFHHAVDCQYCCYDPQSYNNTIPGLSLQDLETRLICSIGKTEAFFIKVQYPTPEALMDSSYLAQQKSERWIRWQRIIKQIQERIDDFISKEEYDELIAQEPKDVLINGRLKNDPLPPLPVNPISSKKIDKSLYKKPSTWVHPECNTERSRNDKDFKKEEEKYEKNHLSRMSALKTPRYEIILSDEEDKKQIALQFENFLYRIFMTPTTYSQSIPNGFKCLLPTHGTKIFDHLDQKEHHMFDIFHYLKHKQYNHDNERAFIRINLSEDEIIVPFYDCDDYIGERDFFKDNFGDKDDKYKTSIKQWYDETKSISEDRDLIVSENTGDSCMLSFYKLSVFYKNDYDVNKVIKPIYDKYEKKFLKEEETDILQAMQTFDFKKWESFVNSGEKNPDTWSQLPKELPILRKLKLSCYDSGKEKISKIRCFYLYDMKILRNELYKSKFKELFTEEFTDKIKSYCPCKPEEIEQLYFYESDKKDEKHELSQKVKYAISLLLQLNEDKKL